MNPPTIWTFLHWKFWKKALEFPGALVLVTTTASCWIGPTEFVAFLGDGNAGLTSMDSGGRPSVRSSTSEAVAKPKAAAKPKQRSKKLSYNEQREFDGMEEAILVAEEKVEVTPSPTTQSWPTTTNA